MSSSQQKKITFLELLCGIFLFDSTLLLRIKSVSNRYHIRISITMRTNSFSHTHGKKPLQSEIVTVYEKNLREIFTSFFSTGLKAAKRKVCV